MHYLIILLIIVLLIGAYIWVISALWALAVKLIFIPLLIGLFVGGCTVFSLFSERFKSSVEIASPDLVVGGKLEKSIGKPKGNAAYRAFDHAWPNYFPAQHRRDIAASRLQFYVVAGWAWNIASATLPHRISQNTGISLLFSLIICGIPIATVGVWFASFAASVIVVFWLYFVLSHVVGVVVSVAGALFSALALVLDRWYRRRKGAAFSCSLCYRHAQEPSFRCPNRSCGVVHHDINPGALGRLLRICGCGTGIPLTVRRATKAGLVPVCPHCEREQPLGAGTRSLLQLPVFGATGVGKTQFLQTAVVALSTYFSSRDTEAVQPLDDSARRFLNDAETNANGNRRPQKTAVQAAPELLPFEIRVGSRTVEMQICDVAGEIFRAQKSTQNLSYYDRAPVLVFVYDGLAAPGMVEAIRLQGHSIQADSSASDMELSYNAVVDRLRNDGVALEDKLLLFVVSKWDVVTELDQTAPDTSSDLIADWVRNNGSENLVNRCTNDFRLVEFMAADMTPKNTASEYGEVLSIVNRCAEHTIGNELADMSESGLQHVKRE